MAHEAASLPMQTVALILQAAASPEATAGSPSEPPASSIQLLATVLLGIVVPTAAFIRPAALDDPDKWPFGRTARDAWAIAWIGVVFAVVLFTSNALTITQAFEQSDERVNEVLAGAYSLLFVVFVIVHVLPLLNPVEGRRRRIGTGALVWIVGTLGGGPSAPAGLSCC